MALDMKYDIRLTERNLKAGRLTDEELAKHIASLPDAAAKAEPFHVQQREVLRSGRVRPVEIDDDDDE